MHRKQMAQGEDENLTVSTMSMVANKLSWSTVLKCIIVLYLFAFTFCKNHCSILGGPHPDFAKAQLVLWALLLTQLRCSLKNIFAGCKWYMRFSAIKP